MIGAETTQIADVVRDLSITKDPTCTLDHHLNMEAHVKSICRASYEQLVDTGRIRGVMIRKAWDSDACICD